MLNQLKDVLEDKGIRFEYTDEAANLVAENSFSEKYGARNMRRYIQKNIEDKLAEQIISDYERGVSIAKLTVTNGELEVKCM